MKQKSKLALLVLLIACLWSCNIKQQNTSIKDVENTTELSATKNYSKSASEANYESRVSQNQQALHIPGIPISKNIKKQISKNLKTRQFVCGKSINDTGLTQIYSATEIPGIYLSTTIKSKLLYKGQESAPVFHASVRKSTE